MGYIRVDKLTWAPGLIQGLDVTVDNTTAAGLKGARSLSVKDPELAAADPEVARGPAGAVGPG